MGKYKWPRDPEIVEHADGTTVTITAVGNLTGITYWAYEVRSGARYVGSGIAGSHRGALIGAWRVRRSYKVNGRPR